MSVPSIIPSCHICIEFAMMLRCVRIAALGNPSEPLVNIIDASLSPPSRGIPYMRDNTQNGSRRTATSFAAMRFDGTCQFCKTFGLEHWVAAAESDVGKVVGQYGFEQFFG